MLSAKNAYSCQLCKKEYTRKSSLDKHKVLCEFKTKSKLDIQVDVEEATDKPTYDELVKIVQELSIKYVKMEEKVTEMQQYIDRKKKKVDVITWLNAHVSPTVGFLEWINIVIVVEPCHFLHLLRPETTIFECLQKVFEYNFEKADFICPLKCFTQKNGTFYICDNQMLAEDGISACAWREMDPKEFVSFLKQVHKKLLGRLSEWRKDNSKLFRDDDKVSDQFNKTVIKLMNVTFGQDASMSRIKNGLFHYLRTDLDCLV